MTVSNLKLYEITREFSDVIEASVDPETGEISSEGLDVLDGLEMAFNDKAVNIIKLYKSLKAEAEAIKAEAKKLSDRAKTVAGNAENLKGYLAMNMQFSGVDSAGDQTHRAKFHKGRAYVKVIQATALPKKYQRQPEVEADKASLLRDMKDGTAVIDPRAATLEEGEPSLVIK